MQILKFINQMFEFCQCSIWQMLEHSNAQICSQIFKRWNIQACKRLNIMNITGSKMSDFFAIISTSEWFSNIEAYSNNFGNFKLCERIRARKDNLYNKLWFELILLWGHVLLLLQNSLKIRHAVGCAVYNQNQCKTWKGMHHEQPETCNGICNA